MPPGVDPHSAAALIGRTIGGRYTIRAAIGSGGMGHVYRATQAPINREVAIKVLRVDLAHQEGVAERFKREARAASLIQHPNAITIYDFGEDDGILYLTMEFLSGETLRQRLRREPPMETENALDTFESMAGALGAAHRVGVVHRDLKPDNIFLAKFDAVGEVVKVLDFGLAKLLDRAADTEGLVTDVNLRLGTPRYMAPEQALGIQPIDSRCDVYALALLLFEMLGHRAPFIGEDGMEVLAQRLRREAPKLSQIAPAKNFGPEMDDLLASMLKRDRAQRPQDANVVLGRLRDIRKNGQVHHAGDVTVPAGLDPDPPPIGRQSGGGLRNPGMSGRQTPVGRHSGPRSNPPDIGGNRGGNAQRPAAANVMMSLEDYDQERPTVVVDPAMALQEMLNPPPLHNRMSDTLTEVAPAGMQSKPPSLPPLPMHVSAPVLNRSSDMPSALPYVPTHEATTSPPQLWSRSFGLGKLLVIVVIALAVLVPLIAWLIVNQRGDEASGTPPTVSAPPPANAGNTEPTATKDDAKSEAAAKIEPDVEPKAKVESPEVKAKPPEDDKAPVVKTVKITISAIPVRVNIYRDSQKIGQTPFTDELPTGYAKVTYLFKRKGYQPSESQIVPDKDHALSITLKNNRK